MVEMIVDINKNKGCKQAANNQNTKKFFIDLFAQFGYEKETDKLNMKDKITDKKRNAQVLLNNIRICPNAVKTYATVIDKQQNLKDSNKQIVDEKLAFAVNIK